MNLTKRVRCHIRMDSQWAQLSAVCMGLSIFLRTVYYFGLINLRDLGGFNVTMQVILPMAVAAGYLLMIKALRINSPTLFGGLVALYAANYMLIMDGSGTAIAGAILLVATAALFVGTGMGYIPDRMPLILAGIATFVFRFLVVDLMTYILPLSQFHPISYLPEASNLFGLAAIAAMCPAVQLSPLRRNADAADAAPSVQEDLTVLVPELSAESPASEMTADSPAASEKLAAEDSAESFTEA